MNDAPLCAESPPAAVRGLVTPNELFFVRDHFERPAGWAGLDVVGGEGRTLRLGASDLERFSQRTLLVTLECAGNGRTLMQPAVAGEPWGLGAVSTAEWSGAPLAELLREAGVPGSTVEVVFRGADGYDRSLPVDVALHPDTLLVTGMNGAALPVEHGGPLRLLVPGWYAMASVKWLTRIELSDRPFEGRFQTDSYTIEGRPIREMRPRAVIARPAEGERVRGPVAVSGFAWTAGERLAAVELSDDGGTRWVRARTVEDGGSYAWERWEVAWEPSRTGSVTLLARARDARGRTQPLKPAWNAGGYCNNSAAPRTVVVVA